jgi:hypothetical protein
MTPVAHGAHELEPLAAFQDLRYPGHAVFAMALR